MRIVYSYRRSFCILLLMLYSASLLKMYLPYVNYCLNYKYISTVLCENRNKPMMHCNGKCHLKKTIRQAEQEDAKSKSTVIKVFGFQEIPTQALQLSFQSPAPIRSRLKTTIPSYISPVMDIMAPPPRQA